MRRKRKSGLRATKRVTRKAATTSSGKLRKGCRFVKGGGAVCTVGSLRRKRRRKK